MSDIENIYYEVFEGRSIKIKPKKKSNIIIQQGEGRKESPEGSTYRSPLKIIAHILSLIAAALIIATLTIYLIDKIMKKLDAYKDQKKRLESLKHNVQVKITRLKDEKEYWNHQRKKLNDLKDKNPKIYKSRIEKLEETEKNINNTIKELKKIGRMVLHLTDRYDVDDSSIVKLKKQLDSVMGTYRGTGSHMLKI